MSRRSEAEGTNLQGALADAIADVLDCEPEKVELTVTAPGIDDLVGVRVQLEVTGVGADAAGGSFDESRPQDDVDAVDAVDDTDAVDDVDAVDDLDAVDDTDSVVESDEAGGRDCREAEHTSDEEPELTPQDLDDEADAAADFLEGLLDAMDLPGDLRLRVHDDHAEIEVVDIGSGALIGRRGQTLEAIQELLRCALQREFQRRARVKVDAEGYRARRMEKLVEKAEEAIDLVLETGEPQRLEPMDVFERKAVHQIVADADGLLSRSQGREPARRVIIERE